MPSVRSSLLHLARHFAERRGSVVPCVPRRSRRPQHLEYRSHFSVVAPVAAPRDRPGRRDLEQPVLEVRLMWTPTTWPRISVLGVGAPSRSLSGRTSRSLHSNAAGASATRGGLTKREGAAVS